MPPPMPPVNSAASYPPENFAPSPVLFETCRPGVLLFTLIVLLFVKVFAAPSSGTLVVSRFKVTLPLMPPPVRSVPAVTPVIVPEPVLLHAQLLPFHLNPWFAAPVLSRLRFSVPVLPPPVRPLPAAVFTPVIVPFPPNTTSSSGGWL